MRKQTGSSIKALAQLAAHDFHLGLPHERRHEVPSPAVVPSGGHAQMLRRLARLLRERANDADPDAGAVVRMTDSVQRTLYHLEAMAPRIYAAGDPELARRFGDLEGQTRTWERDRYLYEDLRPQALWTNAADTAEAVAALVEHAERLAFSAE